MSEPRTLKKLLDAAALYDRTSSAGLGSASDAIGFALMAEIVRCTHDVVATIQASRNPDPNRVRYHGVDVHEIVGFRAKEPGEHPQLANRKDDSHARNIQARLERVAGARPTRKEITEMCHEKQDLEKPQEEPQS